MQARITDRLGVVHSKGMLCSHVEFCQFAVESGFRWVELKYEARLEARDSLTRNAEKTAMLAERHGLRLSVHASYEDPVNVGAEDEPIRRESLRLYEDSLEYARRIGARFMTLHGGHIERQAYSRLDYRRVATRTIDALQHLASMAQRGGIELCIENRHRFNRTKLRFPTYPRELRACRTAVGHDLRFTIDSGHARSVRGYSLDEFVRAVGPNLVGITHLHDNDGTADQHRVPGTGTVDFCSFLTSWRRERWTFPLLLELNSEQDYLLGKAQIEAWLDVDTPHL